MNVGSIALWGFVATVVLTTLMNASQSIGWSRMSIPFMLGTMFVPGRERASIVGFGIHVLNGWIFAIMYALAFESMAQATMLLGMGFGFVHALFVLVVAMPMLPAMHPRMASNDQGPEPTNALEPPGFMALHYGHTTPLVTILAHCVYGAILGGFYELNR